MTVAAWGSTATAIRGRWRAISSAPSRAIRARSGGSGWVDEAVGLDLREHHGRDLEPAGPGREAGRQHPADTAEPSAVDDDQRQAEVGGQIGIQQSLGEGREQPASPFNDHDLARRAPREDALPEERLVDHPPLGPGGVVRGERESEGLWAHRRQRPWPPRRLPEGLGITAAPGEKTAGDRLGDPDPDSLRDERLQDHSGHERFAGIGVGASDEKAWKSHRSRGLHADFPGIRLDWFAFE